MSFPSKFTSFDNSILSKIGFLILEEIDVISLSDLIHARLDRFDDISEFMMALDVLYVLGKIELEEGEGIIRYVS